MASLQQINVGVWNEILTGHPEGAHELVRLGLPIPYGISLSEDDFEFGPFEHPRDRSAKRGPN